MVKECQTFHIKHPKIRLELIGEKGVPVKFNGNNMPESCKELRKKIQTMGVRRFIMEVKRPPLFYQETIPIAQLSMKLKEWNPEDEAPSMSLLLRGAYQKVNSNPTRIIF